VSAWLSKYGASFVLQRLGLPFETAPRVILFVLARYNAHFPGRRRADQAAVWADWANFIRAVAETGRSKPSCALRRKRFGLNIRVKVTSFR
jgi:hypothetical protein